MADDAPQTDRPDHYAPVTVSPDTVLAVARYGAGSTTYTGSWSAQVATEAWPALPDDVRRRIRSLAEYHPGWLDVSSLDDASTSASAPTVDAATLAMAYREALVDEAVAEAVRDDVVEHWGSIPSGPRGAIVRDAIESGDDQVLSSVTLSDEDVAEGDRHVATFPVLDERGFWRRNRTSTRRMRLPGGS